MYKSHSNENRNHEGLILEHCLAKDKQRALKSTVKCFGISLRQQFEENAAVSCPLVCVCSITKPDRMQPVIP
jgi:hypothetical protein